jgi:hypothetical protein
MPSSADLSRQYIEARNAHDLDGLVALVAGAVDFKRPDDPALTTSEEVRTRSAEDWSTHSHVRVDVLRLLESGPVVAEIEVDEGPPSHG